MDTSKIMSKDRKIETKNQHEEQLDGILFMFVDDILDDIKNDNIGTNTYSPYTNDILIPSIFYDISFCHSLCL